MTTEINPSCKVPALSIRCDRAFSNAPRKRYFR